MVLKVRKAESSDYETIYNIIEEAFKREDNPNPTEHLLIEELKKSKSFVNKLSLVAVANYKVVGYILFTEIKIGDKTALALAPLGVLPDYRGNGISGLLIRRGHSVAKHLGYQAVVVLGDHDYYSHFDYEIASKYGIKAPFDVPDENYMVLELVEGALEKFSGTVQYDDAFNVLDE